MNYIRVCKCLICGALIEKETVDDRIVLPINNKFLLQDIPFTSEEVHQTDDHVGLTIYAGFKIDKGIRSFDPAYVKDGTFDTNKLYKVHLKDTPEDEFIDNVKISEAGSYYSNLFAMGDAVFIRIKDGVPDGTIGFNVVDKFVEM